MKTPITPIRIVAGLVGLCALFAMPAAADFVINDDLIVDGSACVGFDCVNGEVFSFDTIKLKENNLRIKFEDTSVVAGFPTRTWQITVNDSNSGGADKFSIEDIDAGRTVFTIRGNAPANSMFVDSSGRLGIKTNAPVLDLHVRSGNTPALRLEQDGSSGFTPQTWDVAGNETNFFVRDATFGSRLPFRIQPNSPTNSIFIKAATGDVGVGTNAPTAPVHILRSTTGSQFIRVENSNAAAQNVGFQIVNTFGGSTIWNNTVTQTGIYAISKGGTGVNELELDASGNLTIQGNCSQVATPGSCADYVFEPDYELMPLDELASFIALNKHLPNVPSTDEIQANGVNVQHFQGRLLEKVEELVLYTLQQKETIDEQQETIQALAARLAALEQPE